MRALLWALLAGVLVYGAALVALATMQRSSLYFPSRAIAQPTLASIEVIEISTSDGETLRAWRRTADAGMPTFLFFNGNGGTPEGHAPRWDILDQRGYGFLAVSYRGYSGSTGAPTEAGLRIDARAAYDRLIADGVAPDDIIIHGLSLGTGVASWLAANASARALILEAPFTAAVDVAKERVPWAPVGLLMTDQFRSRDWIADVDMPLLIVHGDADDVILIAHGRALYERAQPPKTFIRIEGGGHNDLVQRDLYAHVWTFLEEGDRSRR